jgi:predicted nucleotidyltransferase
VVACLRASLPDIAAGYPIMLAYLYGSVAEGHATPSSDVDFLPISRKMVGFRNRLVHLYWHVDDEVLLEVLHHNLGDFTMFARHISTFLARR